MVKRLKRLKIPCLVVVLTTVLMLCLGTVCSSADEVAPEVVTLEYVLNSNTESEVFFVCSSVSGDLTLDFFNSLDLSSVSVHIYDESKTVVDYYTVLSFDEPYYEEGRYFYNSNSYSDLNCLDFVVMSEDLVEDYGTIDSTLYFAYYEGFSIAELSSIFVEFNVTPSESSPLEDIFGLFRAVGNWLATSLGSMLSIFYVDGKLTLLGVLAVVPLAFSAVFLLISILQRFLKFGG